MRPSVGSRELGPAPAVAREDGGGMKPGAAFSRHFGGDPPEARSAPRSTNGRSARARLERVRRRTGRSGLVQRDRAHGVLVGELLQNASQRLSLGGLSAL